MKFAHYKGTGWYFGFGFVKEIPEKIDKEFPWTFAIYLARHRFRFWGEYQ